jgi:hypothetical protein
MSNKYLVTMDGKQHGYYSYLTALKLAEEAFASKKYQLVLLDHETETRDITLWKNGKLV